MKNQILINSFLILIVNIASVILLIIAIGQNPYSYYIFLRVFLFVASVINLYFLFQKKDKFWGTFFFIVAIIYNPILPLYLTKSLWSIINLLTIIFISIFIFASNSNIFNNFKNNNDKILKS